MDPRDRILVALDTHDQAELLRLAKTLGPHVGGFKIGLEALLGIGLKECLNTVVPYGRQRRCVFVDAKLHDIGDTMAGASKAIVQYPGVMSYNVHASAGPTGMRKAAAVKGDAKLLAVTVLTSLDDEECERIYGADTEDTVERLAELTRGCGVDGIICAPTDVERMKEAYPDMLLVTPGVRSKGVAKNDQKRVMTPGEAFRRGSTHIVSGRQLTAADSPVAAAKLLAEEIAEAFR